jgi:7-cyano-7-deazaguanine synthase
MKHVIGLSGGMDSATLLGHLLDQGSEQVHCCSFYYGSKHGQWELKAAQDLVEFYQIQGLPVIGHRIDISKAFNEFKSNLLLSGEDIPEGHYEHESMSQTVVPGRNLILASIMAGLAESVGAGVVALGVHSGDHHIYPDCRPGFITALHSVILASSDGKVIIQAPFLNLDKTGILKIGYNLNPQTPYHLTRTCYKNQGVSCGKCGSCTERLEAFANINCQDPIEYE